MFRKDLNRGEKSARHLMPIRKLLNRILQPQGMVFIGQCVESSIGIAWENFCLCQSNHLGGNQKKASWT